MPVRVLPRLVVPLVTLLLLAPALRAQTPAAPPSPPTAAAPAATPPAASPPAASSSTAASAAPVLKPPACSAAAHRQFDFWIGEWDVRNPEGKVVGRNRIERLHGGCVLAEHWEGNGGFTGSSLNVYDADRKRWHQTWTDSGGGLLLLDGEFGNGRMLLEGDTPAGADGPATRQRIRWTPLPDGRVRQHWEASTDGGATWSTVFDGYYGRRP